MKILFMGFAISNHTRRWVNKLSELGHEVLLICHPDKADDENSISAKVKVHYLKYGGKLGYYLNVPEVKQIYAQFNPDIVNAHFATGYGTTARLAKLKPVVISCWGSDIYKFPKKSFIHKHIVCKNLRYASAIASTSKIMAEETRKVLDEPNREIIVTPFGVTISSFTNQFVEKDKLIIGIVKYLEPIYDIPLLLEAFSIIKQTTSLNPELHIYGGGSLKADLEKLCVTLGINENVKFFGTVPNTEIPKILSSFDVFVNCSLQESFGVAVVEAMASKVPVVVTDTPGYREIVDNGITGIVLKDRKPESMSEAIIELLINKEKAKSYAEAGYEKVCREYDWDNNVQTMLNLYKQIAESNGKIL